MTIDDDELLKKIARDRDTAQKLQEEEAERKRAISARNVIILEKETKFRNLSELFKSKFKDLNKYELRLVTPYSSNRDGSFHLDLQYTLKGTTTPLRAWPLIRDDFPQHYAVGCLNGKWFIIQDRDTFDILKIEEFAFSPNSDPQSKMEQVVSSSILGLIDETTIDLANLAKSWLANIAGK